MDCGGVAVSGYGREADIARSKQAGFSFHITQPIQLPELEAAIKHVRAGEHA